MLDPVLDEILKFAALKLEHAYGYCGIDETDEEACLRAYDAAGNSIIIEIERELN